MNINMNCCFISAGLQNGRFTHVVYLSYADHNEQTKETCHTKSCQKIASQRLLVLGSYLRIALSGEYVDKFTLSYFRCAR